MFDTDIGFAQPLSMSAPRHSLSLFAARKIAANKGIDSSQLEEFESLGLLLRLLEDAFVEGNVTKQITKESVEFKFIIPAEGDSYEYASAIKLVGDEAC